MKKLITAILILFFIYSSGQEPDHIYQPNIHSVKLTKANDIYSYPVMLLNSTDQLQLDFDDLDGDVKSYSYTFQLCNADWSPTMLQPYDYIKGFSSVRISTYRNSSIAYTRYTHYQAAVPDLNCYPSRSGNYILKVYLNGDTSDLAFTKRLLVVDAKVSVAGQIVQPFNSQYYNTYQKVIASVTTNNNNNLNAFSPQDVKLTILQNYVWSSAIHLDRPTIYRGNYYEYSDDNTNIFEAGKEWRWIDLRSLRLMSDRMQRLDKNARSTDVYVKPDADRGKQVYVYYRDLDGIFTIETNDGVNPYWQADYANVHFSFFPPGNKPFEGKSVYLFGELTNYAMDDSSRMVFNEDRGAYEKTLLLKQGYYNYSYVTLTDKKEPGKTFSYENTEGNYWGTENAYMILVYYRPFGGRADELIGYATLNSFLQ